MICYTNPYGIFLKSSIFSTLYYSNTILNPNNQLKLSYYTILTSNIPFEKKYIKSYLTRLQRFYKFTYFLFNIQGM